MNVMHDQFGEFSVEYKTSKDDPSCILGVVIYRSEKKLLELSVEEAGDFADMAESIVERTSGE